MSCRSAISALTKLAAPLARRFARPVYLTPPPLATLRPRRIALVACHWIGDTFWASQTVAPLRRRFPDAEFWAVTKPHAVDLWRGRIEPDHVLTAPEIASDRRRETASFRRIAQRARRLRPIDFDLVIDLTGNRYSAWFTFLLRPAVGIGFDGGEIGWLYSHRVADADRPGQHLSERPFRVIEPLLGEFAYAPPVIPDSMLAEASTPSSAEARPVVLAPGAGWDAKRWPERRFAELARLLVTAGRPVVVIGSDAETDLCRRVAPYGQSVLTGTPLHEVVALLARSVGFVGNDSGPAHLAAAAGVTTVTMFTDETDPAHCRPIGPDVTVLDGNNSAMDVLKALAIGCPS